jgi:S-formylglutathione hydrolase FrmB
MFGACGSMSGALEVGKLRGYDVEKRLGDTVINKQYYNEWSVINVVDKYPQDSLAVIIDCGTEDFLIEENRRTHEKMIQLKTPHTYIERPGAHTWEYWNKALPYQLAFFREFFNNGRIQ